MTPPSSVRRHQLPAFSPLPFSAVVRGVRSLLPGTEEPRELLLSILFDRTMTNAGTLTDSGTSALRLALEFAADRGKVPVALPAFSCYDVATAAVGAGTPVILYDLDPGTLSPELNSLEEALGRGARSVVVASLYGFPVDWNRIRPLTTGHGVVVVEDVAQAHGSNFRGKPPGSDGDLVAMSFGRGKGWTGGGGGALLTRSPEWEELLAEREPEGGSRPVRTLKHLAEVAAIYLLARPSVYGLPRAVPGIGLGETKYRDPHPVRSMLGLAASIALATHDVSDDAVSRRRAVAHGYLEQLDGADRAGSEPQPVRPVNGGDSGYIRFPVLLDSLRRNPEGVLPDRWCRLGAERSYPRTLDHLPSLRSLLSTERVPIPGARKLSEELITLPTHSKTVTAERLELIRALAARGSDGQPRG